jgi:uncharacterized protein YneF (UPF0154 family)
METIFVTRRIVGYLMLSDKKTKCTQMENPKLCKKHLLGLYQSKEQKRRARKLQQDTQQILKRIE